MIDFKSSLLSLIHAAAPLPVSPESPHYWMPLDASVTVRSVDWIYYFLYWMSIISTIVIVGAMGYLVWKYKAKSRAANERPLPSPDHSTVLEVTWSILPLFVLVAVFVWGFKGFIDLRTPPKDAMEIRATGQKWKWVFTYPGGMNDDTLHVPVDRPVRLVISSMDVLHSFFIPNFRVKMDAVPGRYTDLWFQATKTGEFPAFCTEYCGTSHSDMLSRVVVHPPGGYEQWMTEQKKKLEEMDPVELGKLLYAQQGCNVCHSVDGTPKLAPSWKALFGKSETFTDGSQGTVDENYIRQSILEPNTKIVQGFAPSMPTYQGKLSDKQLNGIIEYIKSLK